MGVLGRPGWPDFDELEFERSPATEAKREQGNQRGKNDNHADDGMVAAL